MIRIVCPSCHAPLSTAELEQVTTDLETRLICPECAMVLLSEPQMAKEVATLTEAGVDA